MPPSSPIKQAQSPSVSLRRIAILLLVGLAIFGLLMTQRAAIRQHQLYFTENRQDVSFQFAELSEAWTVNTLRKRFAGYPIHCYPNPGDNLGDLACAMDVKSFNGLPALFISFFFDAGQLQQISINVPWWKHRAAYKYLVASIGPQTASQVLHQEGVRLHGWHLPDGAGVFYNRDKSRNPLQWNGIYWRSASSCTNNACFVPQTK